VRAALDGLQPACLVWAEIPMPGLTYNRRALLADGRVSIMQEPDLPVVQRGPLDERMTLLVWQTLQGKNIAALAHYACHGVAVLSQGIGSDIPGALAESIGVRLGAPCLFLQGAAADVNPTTVTASREEMLAWVQRALLPLPGFDDILKPVVDLEDLQAADMWLDLPYAPLPGLAEAQKQLSDLLRIADGDVASPDLQASVAAFKNTGPGISMATKNLGYGSLCNTGRLHAPLFFNVCTEVLAAPVIREKLVLNVTDGLRAQYDGGPDKNAQFVYPNHSLYFATDPFALDMVCHRALVAKRVEMGLAMNNNPRFTEYLHYAERLGLGIANPERILHVKI